MERNSIKFYESSNGAQRFATLTLAFFLLPLIHTILVMLLKMRIQETNRDLGAPLRALSSPFDEGSG